MTRPSLTDLLEAPPPPPKVVRQKEEVVNLTLRMPRSQWKHVLDLTTEERTKIQPYVMSLIAEDFRRRGLRL